MQRNKGAKTIVGAIVGRVGIVVLGISCTSGVLAQTAPTSESNASQAGETHRGGGRGAYAGMGRVMGEVTAVSGATVTLRSEDGPVQVVTTDNTRVMKDRGPIKVSDLQVGDGLMAVGNMDVPNKTLHAAMIFAQDAAQVKALKENLGKTYITGRVTAVDLDNAKMTVERADHVSQTIGFDETTSFKRAVHGGGGVNGAPADGPKANSGTGGESREAGRGAGGMGMGGMAMGTGIDRAFTNGESITLADIKVGDLIAGTGAVKNGTFVPTRVVDSPPRARRPHEGSPAGQAAPAPGGGAANPGPGQR